MKILADMHISPLTVHFLRNLGHDVVRVNEMLPPNASDKTIIETAINSDRVILTQDQSGFLRDNCFFRKHPAIFDFPQVIVFPH